VQQGRWLADAKSEPLAKAVALWLSYIGVSEGVETDDMGSLGHRIRVRAAGVEKALDLTQVGVGVSQVLPVVTTCLLADRGDILLFEQPELHLHPRVQARLADFFLATSFSGVQCIVETHSEYMVNCLRLRAAEATDDDSFRDVMALYFTELGDEGSEYRRVEITEYGTVKDWPRGFFDETQRQSEAILAAAIAKRRNTREQLRPDA
jgi:predicted ATPase